MAPPSGGQLAALMEHAPSLVPMLQPMWGTTSRVWTPGAAGSWQPVEITDGIFQGESAAGKAFAATITFPARRVPAAEE
eukprot:12292514-Alexandrium_andersonii.AAC.1